MPDMISLRLYPIDYRHFSKDDIAPLRENRDRLKRCPNYFVDEGYVHNALKQVSQRLAREGFGPDRICGYLRRSAFPRGRWAGWPQESRPP